MTLNLYATAGVGLENLVARELETRGIQVTRIEAGRVRFTGDMGALYQSLIHLRCASRVIRELIFDEVRSEQDIYDRVRSLDWSQWLTPDTTFRVQFNVRSSLLRNSQFGLYRIKDAICDEMVDRTNRRPNVDVANPDLYVVCSLENRRFSVGVDAAGDPLHMRGYRVAGHPASLREHLAAAMIMQSQWDETRALHDPFCGSGTLLIEAALLATQTPPSRLRERFGVMSWPDFDGEVFASLRRDAEAKVRDGSGLRLSGADRSIHALEAAAKNAAAAGFPDLIAWEQRPVEQMPPLPDAHIITNPPYGLRSGEDHAVTEIYKAFRTRAMLCRGSRIAVLHAGDHFEKTFSLRPFKRNRLNNGPIRCTLSQYDIRGEHEGGKGEEHEGGKAGRGVPSP